MLKQTYLCSKCNTEVVFGDSEELECDACKTAIKKDSCQMKKDELDTATRLDVQDLLWEDMSTKFTETPEGYLVGRACVTNVGVFSYLVDGKIVNELRLRDDVMDDESLDTLRLKPFTNGHPTEGVDSTNIKKYAVGSVGSRIYCDSDRVYADIVVTDADAVRDIKNGRRALSCGYTRQQEMVSGVHNGVRYDCIQRKIRYNHLALVDRGRAGDDAVLRLDGFVFDGINNSSKPIQEKKDMLKLNIDGVEVEVPDSVHNAFKAKDAALDAALVQVGNLKTEKSTIEAQRDASQEALAAKDAAIADLKAKLDAAPQEIEAKLAARASLIALVKGHGVDLKGDEDELSIKKGLILKVCPKANLDGRDETYVSARFDHAIDSLASVAAEDQQNADSLADRGDSSKESKQLNVDEAKEAYRRSLESASQTQNAAN